MTWMGVRQIEITLILSVINDEINKFLEWINPDYKIVWCTAI